MSGRPADEEETVAEDILFGYASVRVSAVLVFAGCDEKRTIRVGALRASDPAVGRSNDGHAQSWFRWSAKQGVHCDVRFPGLVFNGERELLKIQEPSGELPVEPFAVHQARGRPVVGQYLEEEGP